MNKSFLFVTILFALTGCSSKPNITKTDIEKNNLKGNISHISTVTYLGEVKFGEVKALNPLETAIEVFYTSDKIWFDSNSPEFSNTTEYYNQEGFIDSLSSFFYKRELFFGTFKEQFDTVYKEIYLRYPDKNIKSKIRVGRTEQSPLLLDSFLVYKYFYNNVSKLDSISILGKNKGSVIKNEIVRFKYEDNKLIAKIVYSPSRDTLELTKINESDQIKTSYVYNQEGDLKSEIIIYKDSSDKIIKTINKVFGHISTEETVEYKYQNELLVEKTVRINSKTSDYRLANKNFISIINNSYEYRFDQKNNWVECIRKFKEIKTIGSVEHVNEGYHITKREIEYY